MKKPTAAVYVLCLSNTYYDAAHSHRNTTDLLTEMSVVCLLFFFWQMSQIKYLLFTSS